MSHHCVPSLSCVLKSGNKTGGTDIRLNRHSKITSRDKVPIVAPEISLTAGHKLDLETQQLTVKTKDLSLAVTNIGIVAEDALVLKAQTIDLESQRLILETQGLDVTTQDLKLATVSLDVKASQNLDLESKNIGLTAEDVLQFKAKTIQNQSETLALQTQDMNIVSQDLTLGTTSLTVTASETLKLDVAEFNTQAQVISLAATQDLKVASAALDVKAAENLSFESKNIGLRAEDVLQFKAKTIENHSETLALQTQDMNIATDDLTLDATSLTVKASETLKLEVNEFSTQAQTISLAASGSANITSTSILQSSETNSNVASVSAQITAPIITLDGTVAIKNELQVDGRSNLKGGLDATGGVVADNVNVNTELVAQSAIILSGLNVTGGTIMDSLTAGPSVIEELKVNASTTTASLTAGPSVIEELKVNAGLNVTGGTTTNTLVVTGGISTSQLETSLITSPNNIVFEAPSVTLPGGTLDLDAVSQPSTLNTEESSAFINSNASLTFSTVGSVFIFPGSRMKGESKADEPRRFKVSVDPEAFKLLLAQQRSGGASASSSEQPLEGIQIGNIDGLSGPQWDEPLPVPNIPYYFGITGNLVYQDLYTISYNRRDRAVGTFSLESTEGLTIASPKVTINGDVDITGRLSFNQSLVRSSWLGDVRNPDQPGGVATSIPALWYTRPLNTLRDDQLGLILTDVGGFQFAETGRYQVILSSVFFGGDEANYLSRLRFSDGKVILGTVVNGSGTSQITATFEVTSLPYFAEVEYRASRFNLCGLGRATGLGDNTYVSVLITKLV